MSTLNINEETRGKINKTRNKAEEILSSKWVMVGLTVIPVLILFTFVTVIPIVWTVLAGFHEISAFSPEWEWIGLKGYYEVLGSAEFWEVIQRSVVFTVGSVVLQVVVGLAIAFLVNRSFRFSSLVRAIVMLPYLVPTAILALVALWMGNSQFGIINQILFQAGLIESYVPWYGSTDLAMIAVVFTSSWKFSIFVTILALARLQSIPNNFYEAAEMAGASRYQKFRDITLPSLKGVLFIALLLRGVWMFNKFDIIYTLTKGGPKDATTTVSILVHEVVFNAGEIGTAATMSTLLFVMLGVSAAIYFYVLAPEEEVGRR